MIFRYLLSCYYWISAYLCPSYISGNKHKNSNISYKDYEDFMREIEASEYKERYKYYMDEEEEQIMPLIKSKTEVFAKFKCGYCSRQIDVPQFMYADKAFCTSRCRINLIIQEENYLTKGQSISFSL
jgi:hypothetical protein